MVTVEDMSRTPLSEFQLENERPLRCNHDLMSDTEAIFVDGIVYSTFRALILRYRGARFSVTFRY